MENLLQLKQRRFRASGAVVFAAAVGLLISRIIASLLYRTDASDTLVDVIFTCTMQILFLGVVPFLIYKLYLGLTARGVFRLSNVKKTDLRVLLWSVPLGALALCVTVGTSTAWQVFLTVLGYSGGGGDPMPETFNVGLFLLDIALTGILPAAFEEFTNRGAFLTAVRSSFNPVQTVLLCGLAFGLFHQNVTQIFYTFFFGALCAYLTLKTKSIFPGVIAHFVNNSLSVYLDYAAEYGFFLGGATDWLWSLALNAFPLVFLLWVLAVAAVIAIVYRITTITKRENADDGAKIISVDGEPIEEQLEETILYKPTVRDWAFYIGALVVTALTTFCTFWWGLL